DNTIPQMMTVLPKLNNGAFTSLPLRLVDKISFNTFCACCLELYILFSTSNAASFLLIKVKYLGVSGTINNNIKNNAAGIASVINILRQPIASIQRDVSPNVIP